MGDFNCKYIDWKTGTTNIEQETNPNNCLLKTCRDCYLEQIVDQNTRARGDNTPSLIDLILCYDPTEIENLKYLSPLGKSDHCIILFDYITLCEKKSYKAEKKYYEKANYDAIKRHLAEINWKLLLNEKNVQSQWNIFDKIIKECENKHVPMKIVERNRESKFKELLPEHIRLKIRKKHNLWKRFMETKLQKTYLEYCRVRNKVKNMITYFRKQKEKIISMDVKKNPKAFWKYISVKTKTRSGITVLHCDPNDESSRLTNNDSHKANLLNEYFASVFTNEPHGNIPILETRTEKEMEYNIISDEIALLLKNMDGNKSPSPDGYHPCFIKELADFIIEPIGIIFRNSMESGTIPSQWKEARVSAIYKKGNKKLAGNYRPVSITSVLCRILEKLIRNQIVEYMQSENLLSDLQFGFIKGRSTSLQLLNIMNDWTCAIENSNSSDCIYLDYQKAFDTVPHKRLISKLYAYNIDEKIINWIKYYLSERKQYVEINGQKSEWQKVTSGIPQGSVLGPLLFLIYINDLPDGITSTIYMYADDTKLYREIKSPDDHQILQNDLSKLCTWSKKWLLKFHPKKCSCLTIGKKLESPSYSYDLSSHIIEQVKSIKDIGVTMDSELSFDEHINIKIDTANKIVGIIRRSYRYLNCEIFYHCISV